MVLNEEPSQIQPVVIKEEFVDECPLNLEEAIQMLISRNRVESNHKPMTLYDLTNLWSYCEENMNFNLRIKRVRFESDQQMTTNYDKQLIIKSFGSEKSVKQTKDSSQIVFEPSTSETIRADQLENYQFSIKDKLGNSLFDQSVNMGGSIIDMQNTSAISKTVQADNSNGKLIIDYEI